MKTHRLAVLLLLGLPQLAAAQERHVAGGDRPVHAGEIPLTFAAEFTLVSDYVDRGQSASNEKPTLQTEFTLTHDSGAYVGVWASGIDYLDGESNIELDYFAGYGTQWENGWWADAYAIRYTYPGADNTLHYDFYEIIGTVGYDFDVAEVTGSVAYSPENFADSGAFYYFNSGVRVPLPNHFYTSGEIGYLDIENETNYGAPDYTHWRAGVGYIYKDFDLRLDYHDTNLRESECADICSPRVVFSLVHSF